MRSKEFMDKDVFALDEKIGTVKEIGIDPEDWKVTHLEIELEKNIAESVLGAKKGGVRNMLNISALDSFLLYIAPFNASMTASTTSFFGAPFPSLKRLAPRTFNPCFR